VAALHQREERRALDLRSASYAQRRQAAAHPLTGRLAATGVVVLGAGGDLALVIIQLGRGGPELADRQHERFPSAPTRARRAGAE
jgi:hypothetical protein